MMIGNQMDHDMWRRDEPTAEDEQIAMLGERDPADEPIEPVDVDTITTLTVGDTPGSLRDDEAEMVCHFYDLLGLLADRANAAGEAVTLHVRLPDGEVALGNDLVVMVQPGAYISAWSQGDPQRGYRH